MKDGFTGHGKVCMIIKLQYKSMLFISSKIFNNGF
jgi:hypothetical protein